MDFKLGGHGKRTSLLGHPAKKHKPRIQLLIYSWGTARSAHRTSKDTWRSTSLVSRSWDLETAGREAVKTKAGASSWIWLTSSLLSSSIMKIARYGDFLPESQSDASRRAIPRSIASTSSVAIILV